MRIKASPDDFLVEEIPAYEPSGEGEHVYVRFTKRGLNTDEAVRALCKGAGANPREAGVAGLKDKIGVTTQTISLFLPIRQHPDAEAKIRALELPNMTVNDVKRHGNKLKTGHLHGNRFTVFIRDVSAEALPQLEERLTRIGQEGIPNYFGTQRFGRGGQNPEQARAWLAGKTEGPRDPKMKRFLFSALQSEGFNFVLKRRVERGTWNRALVGDVLQKVESGGLFTCADPAVDQTRIDVGEVSPTGPLFGPKMRAAEGEVLVLEDEARAACMGEIDWSLAKNLGDGTRRSLRVLVGALRFFTEDAGSLRVEFVLPKGAYATAVISAAIDGMEEPEQSESSSAIGA